MIKKIGGQTVLIISHMRLHSQPQSIIDSCFYLEKDSIDLVLIERSVFDEVTLDSIMFSRVTHNLKNMGAVEIF